MQAQQRSGWKIVREEREPQNSFGGSEIEWEGKRDASALLALLVVKATENNRFPLTVGFLGSLAFLMFGHPDAAWFWRAIAFGTLAGLLPYRTLVGLRERAEAPKKDEGG